MPISVNLLSDLKVQALDSTELNNDIKIDIEPSKNQMSKFYSKSPNSNKDTIRYKSTVSSTIKSGNTINDMKKHVGDRKQS